MKRSQVLAAAIALDLLAGEPPAAIHPVVWIGRAIAVLEQRAPPHGRLRQLGWGALTTAFFVGGAAAIARCLAPLRRLAGGWLLLAWMLNTTFAVRALLEASESVRRPLAQGDLPVARAALSSLVSRDAADLSEGLVAAAAIESLAENLTDSALAPWLAYACCGLPGAAAYRALNTLDSMVGYRGRYEYLGKAAAHADDVANLVPARLGAILITLAAPTGEGSMRRALATARAQHARTASPNAGWTMAAMAGALGVELEKVGHYRLGNGPQPGPGEIRRAQRITVVAAALGAGVAFALVSAKEQIGRAAARRPTDG